MGSFQIGTLLYCDDESTDTQPEIIADVMHNYRRISRDIIHNHT